MHIRDLARQTDVNPSTIRYYEQIGLLTAPVRSGGNQRIFGDAEVDRLLFIRHARELGFSLGAIRDLLSLADRPDQSCEAADKIAQAQLEQVERRLARLRALKLELQRMIAQCAGGKIANCRVIDALSDRSVRAAVRARPNPGGRPSSDRPGCRDDGRRGI